MGDIDQSTFNQSTFRATARTAHRIGVQAAKAGMASTMPKTSHRLHCG